MSIGVQTRKPAAGRSFERGSARVVPPTARRAPPRPRAAVADIDLLADSLNSAQAYAHWDDFAPASSTRHAPAELLFALIERMGGAATSGWKGMHVNLVI